MPDMLPTSMETADMTSRRKLWLGSIVLYATKRGEDSILGAVAVDGGVRFSLPAREGSVQEPAWSPYVTP